MDLSEYSHSDVMPNDQHQDQHHQTPPSAVWIYNGLTFFHAPVVGWFCRQRKYTARPLLYLGPQLPT